MPQWPKIRDIVGPGLVVSSLSSSSLLTFPFRPGVCLGSIQESVQCSVQGSIQGSVQESVWGPLGSPFSGMFRGLFGILFGSLFEGLFGGLWKGVYSEVRLAVGFGFFGRSIQGLFRILLGVR